MARILIVDDEKNVRATLQRALELEGHETGQAGDGREALARLDGGGYDLAMVDLAMPRLDGMELLDELAERRDPTPVIILTAHGTVERAVEALRKGAYDFLEKPPDRERLLHAVARALESARLSREVEDLRSAAGAEVEMIGSGPLMDDLDERIRLAAPSDGRVLITGENGTGKELVARAVHRESPRRDEAFVKVNCAAVPESLFESELFGHVKGAFTDARENRKGKFERAHGGTLFLDEVAEIPLRLQAKLLRAIETGEVERVGGRDEFTVDARIIAATNKDLEEEVRQERFRADLYYRLNVVRLHVPPLRDRRQDIAALAERFLRECCRRNGYALKVLEPGALELLAAHDYPGNVRELRNAMERLAILTPGDVIAGPDVSRVLTETVGAMDPLSVPTASAPSGSSLKEQLEDHERRLVTDALERHRWHMSDAARALGLERSHLYKKMKALGIQKPER
jgi:DNA-binding NtrC family response regulator